MPRNYYTTVQCARTYSHIGNPNGRSAHVVRVLILTVAGHVMPTIVIQTTQHYGQCSGRLYEFLSEFQSGIP